MRPQHYEGFLREVGLKLVSGSFVPVVISAVNLASPEFLFHCKAIAATTGITIAFGGIELELFPGILKRFGFGLGIVGGNPLSAAGALCILLSGHAVFLLKLEIGNFLLCCTNSSIQTLFLRIQQPAFEYFCTGESLFYSPIGSFPLLTHDTIIIGTEQAISGHRPYPQIILGRITGAVLHIEVFQCGLVLLLLAGTIGGNPYQRYQFVLEIVSAILGDMVDRFIAELYSRQ